MLGRSLVPKLHLGTVIDAHPSARSETLKPYGINRLSY